MIAGGRPCCFVDLPLLIHSLGTTRLPTDNHDLIRDAYSKQASALLWLTVNSCLTVISLSGKSPFFSGGGVLCFVQGPWKINLVGGLSGEQIWHRVLQWSRFMCEHLPHVWCTKENASTWIMGPCHRQVENCRVSTWPRLKNVPSKNSFHLQHVSPVFDSPFELWGMDTQNEDLEEVTVTFTFMYPWVKKPQDAEQVSRIEWNGSGVQISVFDRCVYGESQNEGFFQKIWKWSGMILS